MRSVGIQAALSQPEWFTCVPTHGSHYVAVVQDKSGELAALRRASPETWARLTPVVEIVGPRTRPPEYKANMISQRVKKIAEAVGQHPCFLDILRLRATDNVATSAGKIPVLSAVYAAARKRHLNCVPVLHLGDRSHAVSLIRDTALQDGRGVALRYPLLSVALIDGQTPESLIEEALREVHTEITGADLLIDLGYLGQEQEIHAEDIADPVRELMEIGAWRSVVLLGTSMPRMLGVIGEGTIGELPRREWDLWSALRRLRLPRIPTYGDYVVQHPDPPQEGGGPGMRANIRYTASAVTLVARGRGPITEEGREQYRELCRMLAARPEFFGRNYSWGDEQIADCATGVTEPGWNNAWRGAGSSHHLRLVTEQLSG
jgi:hypothetical protein